MFTKLYLLTTNPNLSMNQVIQHNVLLLVLFSVLFHTIVYATAVNWIYFIFNGKILNNVINVRLISSLIIIMIIGYISRIIHVKTIYNDFNHNNQKSTEFINQHYNSWIFIG
jgi:hypothetical protein